MKRSSFVSSVATILASVAASTGCALSVGPADPDATTDVPSTTDACIPSRTASLCTETYNYTCGAPAALLDPNVALTPELCRQLCPRSSMFGQALFCFRQSTVDTFQASLNCSYCASGRRPEGYVEQRILESTATQTWLAQMAELEHAAVLAFEQLHTVLQQHNAPETLLQRVQRAADDERRHTRWMTSLAHEHGATPAQPCVANCTSLTLEALAITNAAEGCVRETMGALVAGWQARHARVGRDGFEIIANEEAQHAQLSWDLDDWYRTQVSVDVIAQMDQARKNAVDELFSSIDGPVAQPLVETFGMPDATVMRRLAHALEQSWWS